MNLHMQPDAGLYEFDFQRSANVTPCPDVSQAFFFPVARSIVAPKETKCHS